MPETAQAPETTPEPEPSPEDFKKRLEAMLAKGPPRAAPPKPAPKQAPSWDAMGKQEMERKQTMLSDSRAEFFMAVPTLKK